jgi:glutamate-1-semialdehyde 2,1-aminomutase
MSNKLMAEAREIMPGGVSSPVRAFKSVGGDPVVFDRVKGSKAWDVDGNQYVDYVGTWGPAIVGHADDRVLNAVKETMDKGTSFGAPCALENELAKMVSPCQACGWACAPWTAKCLVSVWSSSPPGSFPLRSGY